MCLLVILQTLLLTVFRADVNSSFDHFEVDHINDLISLNTIPGGDSIPSGGLIYMVSSNGAYNYARSACDGDNLL